MPTVSDNKVVIVSTLKNPPQYLVDMGGQGYNSNTAIAAYLSNSYKESGFSTTIKPQSGENSLGLFQWNGDRQAGLFAFADKQGVDPYDPQTQTAYAMAETQRLSFVDNTGKTWNLGSTSATGTLESSLRDDSLTASQKSNLFVDKFERPLDLEGAKSARAPIAEEYAKNDGEKIDGGTVVAGNGNAQVNNSNGGTDSEQAASAAAANGAGKGKGGACASAGLTSMLTMAFSAITAGVGMGGMFDSINNALGGVFTPIQEAFSALKEAIPGISDIAKAAFTIAAGGNPVDALATLGVSYFPSLGSVLPFALAAASGQINLSSALSFAGGVVGGNLGQAMSIAGGLTGLIQALSATQSGKNVAGGSLQNMINNANAAYGAAQIARNVMGAVGDGSAQQFGGGPNGMGALIRNNDNLATYGVSALGDELVIIGQDFVNCGAWDARNLTRLMQPGNIAAQIISAGLGDSTGLLVLLSNANIPIGNIDNPIYDDQIQGLLYQINDPTIVDLVVKKFSVVRPIDYLGQLTDFTYMLPQSYNLMTVDSWLGLGMMLINMQITNAQTLGQIGSILQQLERINDLPQLAQMSQPLPSSMSDVLTKTYGYGSGTFGELSLADFIGTSAGYVHEDTIPVINDNMRYLYTRPEAQQYFKGALMLRHLAQGKYTTIVTSGTGGEGGGPDITTWTYTVPSNETDGLLNGITPGSIGTFSGGTTDDKTAAVHALIPYIEAGMKTIYDAMQNDADLRACMNAIESAHSASCAQMIREMILCNKYQINLTEPAPITPLSSYMFAFMVNGYADETGHGQMADYLNRVATNDLGGQALRGALRMARNAKKLQPLGIETDRFNLPVSQYYRDPLALTKSLYLGLIPPDPLSLQNTNYPLQTVKQYIIQRDAKLVDSGFIDTDMTPALKDEMYVDLQWTDSPENVLVAMGYTAVSAAVNRNLKIVGDKLQLITLSGLKLDIGTIKSTGIANLDVDLLISTLFDIVNRVIYGDIGVSKNTNPFSTEQIIYAVAEMLASINGTNVESYVNTILGQKALGDFLTQLARQFRTLGTVFESSIDRNKFGAYGGVGPETRFDIP